MHRAGGDAQGRARVGPLGDEAHRRSAEPDAEVEVAEEQPAGGAVISGEGAHAERGDCKALSEGEQHERGDRDRQRGGEGDADEGGGLGQHGDAQGSGGAGPVGYPAQDRAAGDHGMPKRGTTSARRCT
jgi:hypothetical protein